MSEKPPRPLIERQDPPKAAPKAPASQDPQVKRGRPGRTVGLTARIQEIICEVIATGNYQKVAAQAAGISEEIYKSGASGDAAVSSRMQRSNERLSKRTGIANPHWSPRLWPPRAPIGAQPH
jgi:hypothetical protein